MSDETRLTNLFYRLLTFTAAAFVVTVFALVAAAFGDHQAPMNLWFNRNAGTLLSVEVALTLLLGMAAMAVDRIQARRARPDDKVAPADDAEC